MNTSIKGLSINEINSVAGGERIALAVGAAAFGEAYLVASLGSKDASTLAAATILFSSVSAIVESAFGTAEETFTLLAKRACVMSIFQAAVVAMTQFYGVALNTNALAYS